MAMGSVTITVDRIIVFAPLQCKKNNGNSSIVMKVSAG